MRQSLRNFSALSKGETFRILYNKRKYDIGVVEVQPESGTFPPGAPQVRATGPSAPPPRRHRVLNSSAGGVHHRDGHQP